VRALLCLFIRHYDFVLSGQFSDRISATLDLLHANLQKLTADGTTLSRCLVCSRLFRGVEIAMLVSAFGQLPMPNSHFRMNRSNSVSAGELAEQKKIDRDPRTRRAAVSVEQRTAELTRADEDLSLEMLSARVLKRRYGKVKPI
jgi:hypothetical protein